MAKATTTIKQVMQYQPQHAAWFATTQTLFNQVTAFYFDVIQAHPGLLDLKNTEALTALEHLTHTTSSNPTPLIPLSACASHIPAMFRRAAIRAALGSAQSFATHLHAWRKRKEKAMGKGKKFTERPPVPPRTWNKSPTLYAGMWKERTDETIMVKLWTGACWCWLKVRLSGRALPATGDAGSPALVRHGTRWWLHTPIESSVKKVGKVAVQVTTHPTTAICAVDLNMDKHLAVCTIQTVEGTVLATRFIGGGTELHGFRKHLLGRIARKRSQTGIIAKGEQDNQHLWRKIRAIDEQSAHVVSTRIVQFAKAHGATILVFEHLGNLQPEKGRYSHRSNRKRMYWLKGRTFRYAKYKAWSEGIITSRVNPRNTSRECARCHAPIVRYAAGHPGEGYMPGTPLMYCPQCKHQGHADRNASLVIGQRLIARCQKSVAQEKPQTPLVLPERVPKGTGVVCSQDAEGEQRPSLSLIRHEACHGHGTAHEASSRMDDGVLGIPHQLRLFAE